MAKNPVEQALRNAERLAGRGQIERAITIYQSILRDTPDHQPAREAIDRLRKDKSIRSFPGPSAPLHTTKMEELSKLLDRKDYTNALRKAEELLTDHPGSAAVWNGYAAALQGCGELENATNAFEKAISLAPTDMRIKRNLARHHQKLGNFENAISVLKELIDDNPNISNVHHQLGLVQKADGKIEDALKSLIRAMELDPKSAPTRNALGTTYYMAEQPQDAEYHLNKALQIDPDYAEAHFNLGNTMKHLKRYKDAIRHYQKATKINPKLSEAWQNLANTFFSQGNHCEALSCLEKAIELKPENVKLMRAKGRLLITVGRIDEAQSYLQSVSAKFPENADFLFFLGRTYQAQGETKRAAICYCSAHSLSPGHRSAFAALAATPLGCVPPDVLQSMETHIDKVTKDLIGGGEYFIKANLLRHKGEQDKARAFYDKGNQVVLKSNLQSVRNIAISQNQALSRLQKLDQPNALLAEADPISLFILGPSRSGKTQLERLLGSSANVKRGYENPVFMNVVRECATFDDEFSSWNLNAKAKEKFSKLYSEEIRKLCRNRSVFTDTSPHRIYYAWDIADMIPNSFFVIVNRNPEDVASAIYQTHYKSDGNFYAYHMETIQQHLEWYHDMFDLLSARLGDRIMAIEFDELMSNPSEQIRRTEEMLNFRLESTAPHK
jgi:tetratricopeptide (TPR) repeat protein